MTVEIPLTQGKSAIVDDVDYNLVQGWPWCAVIHHGEWRAQAHKRAADPVTLMHNLIMGRKHVRHLNGDGLDNRRCNLTIVDRTQIKAYESLRRDNRSGFRGVGQNSNGRWYAAIGYHGRQYHLGTFDTPQEAALAYDAAASQFFGAHASLNYPLTEAA